MAVSSAEDEFRSLVNHVFLPPQLPHAEGAPSDLSVLNLVSDALDELDTLTGRSSVAINRSKALLKQMRAAHGPSDALDQVRLAETLIAMQEGQTAAVKVSAQNAAVLITREKAQVIFETFELSAENEAVQSARGRLVRDFPASAVAIDLALLLEGDFINMLTKTLSTMSQQEVPEMQAYSKKTGAVHEEDRDTSRPALVSEMFLGMLRGIGTPLYTTSVRKNTREEVLHRRARRPWRRSAMWLLVRVALQLTISRSPDGSLELYKNTMVLIMCRLLSLSEKFESTSELMHVMNAKIDRRRQKLLHGNLLFDPVAGRAENVLRTTHDVISKRWNLVQARDGQIASMAALSSLELSADNFVALPDLDKYISSIQNRQDFQEIVHYQPKSSLIGLQSRPGEIQPLPSSDDAYSVQNLQLFEQWVSRELNTWQLIAQSDPVTVCKDVCQLIKRYHTVASKVYSENPEGLSVMLLTIMELWTACDGAAVGACDLLREFSAGMSPAVVENLLLPFLDQMKRLSKVEAHLALRSQGHPSTTIFSLDSNQGFPNRFYNSSQKHKDLHKSIRDQAQTARQAKLTELYGAKVQYNRLNKLYLDAECEYITKIIDSWCDPPEVETTHNGSCRKCAYRRQRDALDIQVHEWPLPAEMSKANAVVFELAVPEWFVYWRDARFYILHSVLKGWAQQSQAGTSSYYLSADPHLVRYYTAINHRIELLSETKPTIVTHYSRKKIPSATESNVCVPSGLTYQYHDADSQSYLSSRFVFDEELPIACTYKIPREAKAFQKFILRTASAPDGQAPNAVIASQDACPTDTTLEEYKELANIPLGRHVQWLNVLLQLAMPNIDLKKLESTMVVLQCIHQTGPQSRDKNLLRESHHILQHDTFAFAIISNLSTALHRVKENWESVNALCTFIAIATRILSVNQSVREICFEFLRAARCVTATWLLDLREKAYLAMSNHTNHTHFVSKSIEAALLCISTFDVEDQYLDAAILDPDAHLLIWASIVVQEGENNQALNESHVARLHFRSKRLLRRSYAVLSQNGIALDAAVKKAWSGYMPSRVGWSTQAEHWVATETATTARVHYNLLNGELLVNGLPLDQPPAIYREFPLFRMLFGDATVEVLPASTPCFEFSTKRSFGGCAIDLGMVSGQLVVRATDEGHAYETVSAVLLDDKYPHHFSQDYILWYDFVDKNVKFVPKDDPWDFGHSSQWILSQPEAELGWQLSRGGVRVISTVSKTAKMMASILQPLADTMNIHCLLQPGDTLLHAEIPLLRLSFSLNRGGNLLRSREHRSMFIDEDQKLGALVGFQNKMILKDHQSGDRIALILQSDLRYSKKGFHVEVQVNDKAKSKVHVVKVDNSLRRLLDSHDLDCKLFLAYVHALTSHCLPDPATLHTGTEQAFAILRSKAVESFSQLSQENVDMLVKIAQLSPGRQFYPSHMRVMQSVQWNKNLPFLSQHDDFHTVVTGLLRQSEASKLFYPEINLRIAYRKDIHEHLRARASMRSSIFQVYSFGAENHDHSHDEIYRPRDQGLQSYRATNVATMSTLLFRAGDARKWDAVQVSGLWSLMSNQEIVYGAQTEFDVSLLRYDANMLEANFMKSIWAKLPALHRSFKHPQTEKYRFSFMAWLCTMSFASDAQMDQLQLIAICAKSKQLALIQVPSAASFRARKGRSFNDSNINSILSQNLRSIHESPEWGVKRHKYEKKRDYDYRRESAWTRAKDATVERTLGLLKSQWPCVTPANPQVTNISNYINVERAMPRIVEEFNAWYNNRLLYEYLSQLSQALQCLPNSKISMPALVQRKPTIGFTGSGFVSEADLFLMSAPMLPVKPNTLLASDYESTGSTYTASEPRLKVLVEKMRSKITQSKYELDYTDDLAKSLQALMVKQNTSARTVNVQQHCLSTHFKECKDYVECLYDTIVHALTSRAKERTAYDISHSPRVSPVFLLRQLSRYRWSQISLSWQRCIVEYGLAITALQRAARLIRLAKSGRNEDLVNELDNVGHVNWDAYQFPETLLIEAESGIMVRPVQEQIAGEMRQPSSGRNAVMQLNMGEGKSSVIIPTVAVYLADGTQLVRVIVAKPQSKQMAQMLISKLGGLVGRRVYYLPYARAIQPNCADMDTISAMLSECMSQGGILLMQPEHILSFKLMVPETLISGQHNVAQSAIASQSFLERYSRDLVDESDENFSPRFELIYTMGTQRLIESSPGRWLLIAQVLELVRRAIPAVARKFPCSIETIPGIAGAFPRTRILREDAADFFVHSIAARICGEGLLGFPISRHPPAVREAVFTYITKSNLSPLEVDLVECNATIWTETARSQILLLRGLFANGVLVFVLGQKRWRVNYGFADRTPPTKVAVPFRAKDTPALRSEFSHPDVIITLTLLSYYYQGLNDTELFSALAHLVNSDQAEITYQEWVKDSSDLTKAFTTLKGINMEDRPQCTNKVFPALRHGKSVIDYYVSHIVFPKEMKEFPDKLSASGWDIGKAREQLTTGFSGTIDSRHVLPLDVAYLELLDQKHTNALVMEHLLQPENGVHLMAHSSVDQSVSEAERLLACVMGLYPPVQVILDVGAQILELDNLEMAKAWLEGHDNSKEAVVFVDNYDEICVVDRKGRVSLLLASSYQSRLDVCLVFLDEAHTRGIDLVLPLEYRAAVTLGPRLTKDRLVQACMRMRKLGKGQTVIFCISQEIQTKILEASRKTDASDMTVADILEWSMHETLDDLRRNMPLWAVQGERFVRQEKVWNATNKQNGQLRLTKADAEKLLEPEAQSLEDRYRPCLSLDGPEIFAVSEEPILQQIATRCEAFDITQFKASALQEEQERELSPEMEQERQIQRAPTAKPSQHVLHPDVQSFASTGKIISDSQGYCPAFAKLRSMSTATTFDPRNLMGAKTLLATTDFADTVVKNSKTFVSDAFLRSIQWIITSHDSDCNKINAVMVISPYEANLLVRSMEKSTVTTLHLYRPRVNSAYPPLDALNFYTTPVRKRALHLPHHIAAQLNLFAGQLYFKSYDDYLETCKFLGLLPQSLSQKMEKQGWKVDAAGFIVSDDWGRVGGDSGLSKSPINFLKGLFTARRNGHGIGKSHVGKLLEGHVFQMEDFED